jgi:4-amino-4-deoxy-L-arabinose transferase-like glycosyltransferase
METDPLVLPRSVEEPVRRRLVAVALALAVAALFLIGTHRYAAPANPDVDENAYLVSGKLLAHTGSPGFVPPDPYSLVGMMWISTPEGRFYPKYPLGETLLVAATVKAFGLRAAYLINPLLMTLALLGVFLLVRGAAGSLAGLLGMLMMATSPALLAETNDPDSHASSVFFTVWGMVLLFRWWRSGAFRHAALAGLLLGLATITRYTEGLLLLPMALVALFRLGRRWERRSVAAVVLLAAGWLLPVAGQVAFNLRVLHRLTGYDATHESAAFSLGYFGAHAGLALRQLCTLGLPLLFPLAVLGLALLAFRERRLGLVLWAWALPNLLLYMSYYWAPDDVAYSRFFLSAFPPLALGLAWMVTRPLPGPDGLRRWAQPAMAALLVLACAAFGLRASLPLLQGSHEGQLAAWSAEKAALAVAPAGSVLFGPQQALLHLQFVGDDYRLYSRTLFATRRVQRMGNWDPRAPSTFQPERARALYQLLKDRTRLGMWRLQRDLAAEGLGQERRVFLIAPGWDSGWTRFAAADLGRLDHRAFELHRLAQWTSWGENPEKPGEREQEDWELIEVTMSPMPAVPG